MEGLATVSVVTREAVGRRLGEKFMLLAIQMAYSLGRVGTCVAPACTRKAEGRDRVDERTERRRAWVLFREMEPRLQGLWQVLRIQIDLSIAVAQASSSSEALMSGSIRATKRMLENQCSRWARASGVPHSLVPPFVCIAAGEGAPSNKNRHPRRWLTIHNQETTTRPLAVSRLAL